MKKKRKYICEYRKKRKARARANTESIKRKVIIWRNKFMFVVASDARKLNCHVCNTDAIIKI